MWAILGTLSIIIVILLYYNYSTRNEYFVGAITPQSEVYIVRPDEGYIEVDASYTAPQAVARSFGATIATLAQVQDAFTSGIVNNTIYPMWDVSGIVAYSGSAVQVVLPVRPASASGSASISVVGSSSSSGSGVAGPTLLLTSIPLPTVATPLTVPGVLLYGPKPPYEQRTVGISGRNYTADFYNYGRNVWSRVNDVVQYKCKNISGLTTTVNKTYGDYANILVSILQTPGVGSKTVPIQITGGVNKNRTYPGCDPTCDVCEKTKDPYYNERPSINKNAYESWKGVVIKLDIDDRVLNDQIPPSGKTDPSKLTSSLRLIDACRTAGGIPSLSVEDKAQYKGCPAASWCCAPDTDIPIVLPLAQDDPAASSVGKTCEPTEEAECDDAPRPASNDTDAYRLSKDGQRSRITSALKLQYCKSKSASIRTLAQERKSEKLLKRLAHK